MSFQTIISVEELNENINQKSWCLFDCRFSLKDPKEGLVKFNQGHIPGAQFADMDTDLSSTMTTNSGRHPLPDPIELIEKLQNWGVSNASQVICYDDMSGAFAARMWWLMKWLGHDDTAVLDGGLSQWTKSNLPIETDVHSRPVGTFNGEANNSMWVDINFIQEQLELNKIHLLDARTSDRYTAKDRKTDPVAGHIPGALSFPFAANLTKQGKFKPAKDLHKRFSNVFSNDQTEVINMCGSGVTACHNLLAMNIAGLPLTRLYVGSWSEWIKEKSRPVATGES